MIAVLFSDDAAQDFLEKQGFPGMVSPLCTWKRAIREAIMHAMMQPMMFENDRVAAWGALQDGLRKHPS